MSGAHTWTPSELAAFFKVARERRLEAIWHLVATAGLRVGELLALRWTDVDLDSGRLDVRNAVVNVPYSAIRSPSGWRRARTVELEPCLVELLRGHRARQLAERTEWGAHYRDRDLVVCRANGEPLHPRVLATACLQIAKVAGLGPICPSTLRGTGVAATAHEPASR